MTILAAIVGVAVGWLLPQPLWFTTLIGMVKAWWEAKNKQ